MRLTSILLDMMTVTVPSAARPIALQSVMHPIARTTVGIDLPNEGVAHRLLTQQIHMLLPVDAAHAAQLIGEGMRVATGDVEELHRVDIHLEETCAQDPRCHGLGDILGRLSADRDPHLLYDESHRHIEDHVHLYQ